MRIRHSARLFSVARAKNYVVPRFYLSSGEGTVALSGRLCVLNLTKECVDLQDFALRNTGRELLLLGCRLTAVLRFEHQRGLVARPVLMHR